MSLKNVILHGHVLDKLLEIPDQHVHCVVTSPPYWKLRKYDVDDVFFDEWKGQLGQEPTPEEFVQHLVSVFDGVHRILRNDGTLWVNIGDSYHKKSLCAIPWMFAIEMKKHGWYLRNDHIYSRATPMPASVKDRFIRSHEYIFMFTKSSKYYYDWFNGREPAQSEGIMTRNKRTVMLLKHGRYQGDHYASFGQGLVEPLIAVSTSDHGCCDYCGAPFERLIEKRVIWRGKSHFAKYREIDGQPDQGKLGIDLSHIGWKKCQKCESLVQTPCIVMDPFMGTGVTLLVAQNMGRNWIGIELSEDYINQANRRLGKKLL